jgi:outer membrane lipoprotein-sorting protein
MTSLALTLVLVFAARAVAEDDAAIKDLLDKATKAAGGADKLEKFNAATWTEKGTYHGTGTPLPYTGKYAMQYPDNFRMEIEGVFVICLAGDKGWIKNPMGVVEMDKDQLKEQREQQHLGWQTTKLHKLQDKKNKLTLTGETKVGDKPALGLRVSSEGHRDITLYFDKESHLLVKVDHVVKSDELGKEVNQETILSNHKEIGGIKHPMKVVVNRDGKVFVEAEEDDMQLTDKLPDGTFAKPE